MEFPQPKSFRYRVGFTMIETLVVVVVVGLLAAMSMSVWKKVAGKARAQGDLNDLHKALVRAKSDAITKGRHSGVLIDVSGKRHLRFVDSSATGAQDGQYAVGERILQGWTQISPDFKFFSVASSLSPQPTVRKCGTAASGSATAQSGLYSIVFRPDGTSWSSLTLKAGNVSIPGDTTRLYVIQAAGLVYKAK